MASPAFSEQQFKPPVQSAKPNKDWDAVIRQCKTKLAEREISVDSQVACYSLLGKAFVNQGKDEAAIAAYTECLKQVPHQSETHYALGILYARNDKPARAICHYQIALQIQPNWVQAIFRLGSLFHQLGCSLQAYETYQQALTVAPDYADAYVAIGFIHEQRSEPRLAIKHYRKAAYLQPKQAKARRGVGRVLAKMKAYDAAIEVYRRTLSDLPEDAQTYSSLAQVLLAKGEKQQAIAAYRQALSLDNTLIAAHLNLGRLWRSYQDLEGATAQFNQALQQMPDSLPALSDYADTLAAKGDWEELIESFRLAVRHQPDWIANYCNRTVQLSEQDLLFRVQRTCGRFLIALQQAKSEESTAILKERLAQIYEYLGDLSIACDAPGRAEQCYRTALAIMPYALGLYARLGDYLQAQGRSAAAIALYQAGFLQSEQIPVSEARRLGENSSVSNWRSQLEQRWQTALAQLSSSPVESPAECELAETYPIAGTYPTVKDWQAAQERSAKCVGLEADQTAASISTTAADKTADTEANTSAKHQCGGVTCQVCMNQLIQRFSPIQVGKQSFRCSRMTKDVAELPTFTATLPNGRIWVAPQRNAWDVCNEIGVFSSDGYLIGDLSRAYPWYLPGCQQYQAADHSLLKPRSPLPPAKYLAGKVAVLPSLSGHIYYHWMFDTLPRIAILKQSLEEQNQTLDNIDFFVVNNFEKEFQKETLIALDIPLEKVIASDRAPHIQAQQLIVPSFAGHLDWVPPRSLKFLRSSFMPANSASVENDSGASDFIDHSEISQPPRIKNKRLYITRKKAKYRYLFNEADVVKMLAQFGFVSVALETLSVAEQIELFSEAEVIVAPHGSGLTNLAFCRPETTVIEFFSPNYVRTDYWMISEYLNLHHYYLIGESLECHPLRQLMYPSGLTEDFSINVGELRSLLRTAGVTT